MGNVQAEKNEIRLENYPEKSILQNSLQLTSKKELGQIIILPNTGFNQKEAAKIISRIDKLPPTLITKIHRRGIVVKLFSGRLTDNRTASHLKGVIPRGYANQTTWDDVPGLGGGKTVLVKIGASDKGNGHGSVNLELHELAHSIDRHIYHDIRFHSTFIKIWNEEKDKLFPGKSYFLNYQEEYFAECFAYFYMGGKYQEELKRKAPLTYEFIKKLSH